MAFKIIQLAGTGGASAATTAKIAANKSGKIAKLKEELMKIKKYFTENKKVKELVDKAKDIKRAATAEKKTLEQAASIVATAQTLSTDDFSQYTEADYVKLAAELASMVDPTGIAGIVEKFTYPKCN